MTVADDPTYADSSWESMEARIGTQLARSDLTAFCEHVDPTYAAARHTRALCASLEAIERGEIDRLAIFLPPRHGKTLHTSQRFPAWYLGCHPSHQLILTSYAAELAESNSRSVRNLLQDPRYPFDVEVAADSGAVTRWATDQGGVVVAAGVGGGITGFGAHCLIIDDYLRNREDADSDLMRERGWRWYLEVARTRLMPKGAIVICATRWHEDDMAGRILNGPDAARWTVLEMPAINDAGEALWPAWFNSVDLNALRLELGTRAWQALYQQRPTADEGGLFKRAWFTRFYTEHPPLRTIVQSVDSAFKTGVANDYSCVATWGSDGVDYYLLNVVAARVEFPELCQLIAGQYAEYRPSAVLIEDTASGQAAIQMLRRSRPMPIVPIKVNASKIARASAVSPICEAGKVVLPLGASWVEPWIEEHVSFPTAAHDDMVDTTSMALARLALWSQTLADMPNEWGMKGAEPSRSVTMSPLMDVRRQSEANIEAQTVRR